MNLQEACEKAARYWLGWGVIKAPWNADRECWHDGGNILRHPNGGRIVTSQDDGFPTVANLLASPWGMDLLLNAAQERPSPSVHSICIEDRGPFGWYVQMKSPYGSEWFTACHENRYHAIVYAFAKAADVLEGV